MTDDRLGGCRTCGRFEVGLIEARRHLERYVRYRPPRVGDQRYAERIAELKAEVADSQSFWDDHVKDQHSEVTA